MGVKGADIRICYTFQEPIDRRTKEKTTEQNRWSCEGTIWNCDVVYVGALSDEHLRPVVAALNIPHADLLETAVEDVGAVTRGIHPAVDHALRCTVAHGDILTCGAVFDPELLHHVKRRSVGGGCVAEIAFIVHIL